MAHASPALVKLHLGDQHAGWWDETLTQVLLSVIPSQATHVVDYRCGMGRAAHTLLPRLHSARYTGVELNEALVEAARRHIEQSPLQSRVELLSSEELRLPVADASADVVLSVLALHHCTDLTALLAEVRRVLAPGGVLVAMEADTLGQRYYFDGALEGVNDTMRALLAATETSARREGLTLGPRLPAALQTAGFDDVTVRIHTLSRARRESARSFCQRLGQICDETANSVGTAGEAAAAACRTAIHDVLVASMPQRVGFSAHIVPTFVCAAKLAHGVAGSAVR